MDSQPQRQPALSRQGLSFHFEMAVSWTPKNAEPPKSHRIALPHKKNREEVSATAHAQRSGHAGEKRRGVAAPPALEEHGRSGARKGRQGRPDRHHPSEAANVAPTARRARSSSLPRRYRPGPSHAHATVQGIEGYGHVASYDTSRRNIPEVWKALPPTPSPSNISVDDVPFMYPGQEIPGVGYGHYVGDEHNLEANITDVAHDLAPRIPNERPTGWVKEMESLATAMMTIDNGFEDQWWNQGSRLVNVAGELIPANVGARGFRPGTDMIHTVSTRAKDGVNVRTAVDEVSIQTTDYNAREPVSPVSNTSGPVLSYVYY